MSLIIKVISYTLITVGAVFWIFPEIREYYIFQSVFVSAILSSIFLFYLIIFFGVMPNALQVLFQYVLNMAAFPMAVIISFKTAEYMNYYFTAEFGKLSNIIPIAIQINFTILIVLFSITYTTITTIARKELGFDVVSSGIDILVRMVTIVITLILSSAFSPHYSRLDAIPPSAALSVDGIQRIKWEKYGDSWYVADQSPISRIKYLLFFEGNVDTEDVHSLNYILSKKLGKIETGSIEKSTIAVMLNSNGGDIKAGIAIGEMFRSFGMTTIVAHWNKCYSACAIMFLGGLERYYEDGAILGIHQFAFSEDKAVDLTTQNAVSEYVQMTTSDLLEYFDTVDVHRVIAAAMLRTPHEFTLDLTAEEMRNYDVAKPLSSISPNIFLFQTR